MRLSHLILGGAALAGAAAFALPASAGDFYVTSPGGYVETGVVYGQPQPYGTYETYAVPVAPAPAPGRTIIVREVPAEPMPPAYVPAPAYGQPVYAAPAPYEECRDIARETPSGRLITVANTCD